MQRLLLFIGAKQFAEDIHIDAVYGTDIGGNMIEGTMWEFFNAVADDLDNTAEEYEAGNISGRDLVKQLKELAGNIRHGSRYFSKQNK